MKWSTDRASLSPYSLEGSSSDQPAGNGENSSILSEKLTAIETVLSGEILPAIKEMKVGGESAQMDLSPVIEDKLFVFVPPKGSYKIKFAKVETATENTN